MATVFLFFLPKKIEFNLHRLPVSFNGHTCFQSAVFVLFKQFEMKTVSGTYFQKRCIKILYSSFWTKLYTLLIYNTVTAVLRFHRHRVTTIDLSTLYMRISTIFVEYVDVGHGPE